MKLKKVLSDVKVLYASEQTNIDIKDICINTNKVIKGCLYVCLKGENFNGHDFKELAKQKGAVAFLVEEFDENFDGIQILVSSTRLALSLVCKNFYKIKRSLKVIGITGTNGKTTTTYILSSILKSAGKKVGIIGTEGIVYGETKVNLNMTTPDPIELFKYLHIMSKQKIDFVVMEVSAHAIYYNKTDAIKFYAKGFTNLTEDHLDFFESIERYAQTKVKFMLEGNCIKVVNADDDCGAKLCEHNKKIYSFGGGEYADVFAYDLSQDYSSYTLNIFDKQISIKTKLIGQYNTENVMLAVAISHIIGISEKYIKNGIETFEGVNGRMNVYKNGEKTVIIDFAHTPDAINRVLKTIKEFVKGKLFCVFGCGGNRDTAKRMIMGEIASNLCDMVYISNDNPRFEDEMDIANQIASGIKKDNYEIILDRKKAIKTVVENMQDGDVVALLGKGTEDYIDISGVKYPYSDKEEVLKWGFKN